MGDSKRYYWLKLPDTFFTENIAIKKLRKLTAGGDTLVVIYMKMLLASVKTGGKLYIEDPEEPIAEEIATLIDEDRNNVQLVLNYLAKRGIIKQCGDHVFLTQLPDMVGSETDAAGRKRKQREREKEAQKCLPDMGQSHKNSGQCHTQIGQCHTDVTQNMGQCHTQIGQCHTDVTQNMGQCHTQIGQCHTDVTNMSQVSHNASRSCHVDIDIDKDIEEDIDNIYINNINNNNALSSAVCSISTQYRVSTGETEKESESQDWIAKLGDEILTQAHYSTLLARFSKKITDSVIKRIIDRQYYGCLNLDTVEKWCSEAEKKAAAVERRTDHGFKPRDQNFDDLEAQLLNY